MTELRRWLLLLALPGLVACQAPAPRPHDVLVREELALIVADQPCGVVNAYERRGRLHYRVICATGQAYRVRVSADGRVEVKPD